jgi:hypothetical protein
MITVWEWETGAKVVETKGYAKSCHCMMLSVLTMPSGTEPTYAFGFHPRTRQLVTAGPQFVHFLQIKV